MREHDTEALRCPTPQRHREMLAIACVVIAASFLLRVHAGDQVHLAGASELVLPPLCLSRAWFGVSCPGCGLTRSFIYLAQGDWQASWSTHHLGWLLASLVLLQIPYRIHGLCRPRTALLSFKMRHWIALVLIGLLIGNWLVGMVS
jgi:hypothetical protein